MRRSLILLVLLAGCSLSNTPEGLVGDPRTHLKFEPSTVQIQTGEVTKEFLLYLHNKERGQEKLDQLDFDSELNQKAQEHAEWMAKRGALIHSRGGDTKFNRWGENIAMGYDTEEKVMAGWMHSSGHKRNILTKHYSHAGIGIAKTSGGTIYWCAQFGGE